MEWTRKQGREDDRGHLFTLFVASIFMALVVHFAPPLEAQGYDNLSLGLDHLSLAAIENSPETSTESTIIEIPVPITLREPADGKIGIRLRLSIFFAWNNVLFEEIGGEDIAASLRTLTIVPGLEFMVPVGERWLVRPYFQIGGLSSLDVSGHRWMTSLGARVGTFWRFERWILSAGARLEYTSVFDEEWRRADEVAFIDLGGDFSFPLWFNVMGERAAAGFYVFTGSTSTRPPSSVRMVLISGSTGTAGGAPRSRSMTTPSCGSPSCPSGMASACGWPRTTIHCGSIWGSRFSLRFLRFSPIALRAAGENWK